MRFVDKSVFLYLASIARKERAKGQQAAAS
jgi:hypothetical protein